MRSRAGSAWKVLVVDDDRTVRSISELVLRGLRVDGRAVELFAAASAADARACFEAHPDIAVALIDVIMESPSAGIELVDWVRRQSHLRAVRLVLRTGEPGNAPEAQIMADHDLHDYLSKTETTARRLVSCVMGAVRAWRDQDALQRQRSALQALIDTVERVIVERDVHEVIKVMLERAHLCFDLPPQGGWLVRLPSRPADGLPNIVACHPQSVDTDVPLHAMTGTTESSWFDMSPRTVVSFDSVAVYRFSLADGTQYALGFHGVRAAEWSELMLTMYGDVLSLYLAQRISWEQTIRELNRVVDRLMRADAPR